MRKKKENDESKSNRKYKRRKSNKGESTNWARGCNESQREGRDRDSSEDSMEDEDGNAIWWSGSNDQRGGKSSDRADK